MTQTQQAQGRATGDALAPADGQETRQTAASVADTSDLSEPSGPSGPSDYVQLMESFCLVEFRDCLTRGSAFLETMPNNNVK